jgi:hypothetical protein
MPLTTSDTYILGYYATGIMSVTKNEPAAVLWAAVFSKMEGRWRI